MTTVVIQSNKIVSGEFNDSYTLLEPSYRKKPNELFGQPSGSCGELPKMLIIWRNYINMCIYTLIFHLYVYISYL